MGSRLNKKTKNILVLGCSGLLGKCLIDYYQYKKNLQIHVAINKTQIKNKNLTIFSAKNKNLIDNYVKKNHIDAIINFAALTNLEFCERNVYLSKKLIIICQYIWQNCLKKLNVKYVFISTDNFKFKEKKLSEDSKLSL